MIKLQLYKKTVDILFDAYFNDTLEHVNCSKCAVGNIVAANMGIPNYVLDERIFEASSRVTSGWPTVFVTVDGKQELHPELYFGEAKTQIDATGYTWHQLAEIEKAFESVYKSWKNNEENMFNGLVAVLEVLKQIHQVDDNTSEVARFKSHRLTRFV